MRLHDTEGFPLGYAGRVLDSAVAREFGKWKVPTAFPKASLLYGRHHLGDLMGRGLVVTECPWGVLRLAQVGLPAVALLGCHLSEPQLSMLARSSQVTLLLDGDQAGRVASQNIRKVLESKIAVHVATLPDECDPDDLTDGELLAICRWPHRG